MAEQFDAIFKKGGTATNTADEEAKLYKSPQPKRGAIDLQVLYLMTIQM
jgi:hypothetical protein